MNNTSILCFHEIHEVFYDIISWAYVGEEICQLVSLWNIKY